MAPAQPCLWTISPLRPLVTRGPKSLSLKDRTVPLPGLRLLYSSLPPQAVQLASHNRATDRRTTCPLDTMLLVMLRLLVGLQRHRLVDTVHTCRQTRSRCLETVSAGHLALRPQHHHPSHPLGAMIVLPRREVVIQTTTVKASLPSTHQATPGAASTATVSPALVTCLSMFQAVQQKLVAALQVRIWKTCSNITAVRTRKRGSRKISISSPSCSGCHDRSLS